MDLKIFGLIGGVAVARFVYKVRRTSFNTCFISFVFSLQFNTMSQVDADVGTEQMAADSPEPLFGTIDYIILVALLGFGTWWLLKRKNKQEEAINIKSYSIQ